MNMERNTCISEIEQLIRDCECVMQATVHDPDTTHFQRACESWRQANEAWLQIAQGMSPEKAHAIIVGMAVGGAIHTWMTELVNDLPCEQVLPPNCKFARFMGGISLIPWETQSVGSLVSFL